MLAEVPILAYRLRVHCVTLLRRYARTVLLLCPRLLLDRRRPAFRKVLALALARGMAAPALRLAQPDTVPPAVNSVPDTVAPLERQSRYPTSSPETRLHRSPGYRSLFAPSVFHLPGCRIIPTAFGFPSLRLCKFRSC